MGSNKDKYIFCLFYKVFPLKQILYKRLMYYFYVLLI